MNIGKIQDAVFHKLAMLMDEVDLKYRLIPFLGSIVFRVFGDKCQFDVFLPNGHQVAVRTLGWQTRKVDTADPGAMDSIKEYITIIDKIDDQ